MSALAPTTTRPPRLPEPLRGRSAVVIAPAGDGGWYAWWYVWGQHNGEAPTYMGRSRAEVSRNLQAFQLSVPVWIEPS
jgi:hypothetical protein